MSTMFSRAHAAAEQQPTSEKLWPKQNGVIFDFNSNSSLNQIQQGFFILSLSL